jgi:hypothetical protein
MQPPLPFRPHADTWRESGFENLPVRFSLIHGYDCERLREFMLYAQARQRGWRISSVHSGRRLLIDALKVEFGGPESEIVSVEYFTPTLFGDVVVQHSEGCGFFWLGTQTVSAHCATMSETLAALDAFGPYAPIVKLQRLVCMDAADLKTHLRRCLLLESDPVRTAALERKLNEMEGYF